MKIGILTFHRSHNYGAVLQAYASKTYLNSKNIGTVRLIDYEPYRRKFMYAIFSVEVLKSLTFRQKINYIIRHNPIWMWRKKCRRKAFSTFYENYLCPLWNKNEKLDVIVYGSDQIWNVDSNTDFSTFDACYYGDSTLSAKRKITYSASMGKIQTNEEFDEFVRCNMPNFNSLSVREKDLEEYIKRVIPNINIRTTVDPVFLLSKSKWEELIPQTLPHKKYILVYNLNSIKEIELLARKIKNETGYEIKRLTIDVSTFNFRNDLDTASPLDFLWLIKNAEYIITSSFHGVAFSIIFQKSLYASLPGRGLRIKSLLKTAGLESRWFDDYLNIDSTPINWESVNDNMSKVISHSKDYLDNAIVLNADIP